MPKATFSKLWKAPTLRKVFAFSSLAALFFTLTITSSIRLACAQESTLPVPLSAIGKQTPEPPQEKETKGGVEIISAAQTGNGITLPLTEDSTDPAINLTPDKSELVRLSRDAGTIVVGNPDHVNIIADSPRTLVVIPRLPGATYFSVLDKKGELLMQRHVIVAGPEENYIRIRRTCSPSDTTCEPTRVFYCPDMCHEIHMNTEDSSGKGNTTPTTVRAEDTMAGDAQTSSSDNGTEE